MSRLFRISLLLAFFFGLEKVLGFVRQVVIARQFGLSAELDAFNAANNIPDLIFVLISGGAVAMAFIPILTETIERQGRAEAWRLFSSVANLVFLFSAAVSIIVALLAQPLVEVRIGVAPGFGPEQQALVADLMRLNLIATLLFSLAGLVSAALYANQHFLLPAMAPAMYDIGMLVGALVLAPETPYSFGPITLPAFGMGIYGLVYGVILGAALFFGIQVPGLLRFGFHWVASLDLRDPLLQRTMWLLLPRVGAVAFIQFVFLAQDNFASYLSEGAVSALVYGWLIMQVPETLIGTAVGTALLPTLSEQIARGDLDDFYSSLQRAIRAILALTIPISALLIVVIRPLVAVFAFDAAGTEMIVWTARVFLLGLAGHALLEVAARAFYARQDALTPLLAAGIMAGLFVVLAAILTPMLGAPGIALANGLAFSIEALLLLGLMARRRAGFLRVERTLARVLGAAAVGGAVSYVITQAMLPLPAILLGTSLLSGLMLASLGLGLGALVAAPLIWPEIKLLLKL